RNRGGERVRELPRRAAPPHRASAPRGGRMTKGAPLVRVLLRGGVVSPADLLQVVELARRVGCEGLLPGVRQDLLFPVEGTSPDAVVEVLARSGLSAA